MNPLAPPQDLEAEQACLGALLLSDTALPALLADGLARDDFYRDSHRLIFEAITSLHGRGEPADTLTVVDELKQLGTLRAVGGAAAVEVLAGPVPAVGNVRSYARIVRETAALRRKLHATYEIQAGVYDRDEQRIADGEAMLSASSVTPAAETDTAGEFMAWYDQEQKGWPLPFAVLTEAIGGGMFPGETTIIGSWSGFGKTFLLSQFLRGCRKAGADVVEFASEMHGPKRTARTLTSMTGIPTKLIERKRLNPEQLRTVLAALKSLPYQTVPSNGWPAERYAAEIRRRKPDVAAIDTVSNLPCSRIDEWDRAATVLADAAAQAGTHLIQVFQLNLERDKGKRPPPVARDLRFGGTFYARCRNCLFLHRDQESKDAGDSEQIWVKTPEGHVRVDKATHGAGDPSLEFLPVTFNSRFLRFDEQDAYRRPLEVAA